MAQPVEEVVQQLYSDKGFSRSVPKYSCSPDRSSASNRRNPPGAEGPDAARPLQAADGSPPAINAPLEQVQIDHGD